MTNRFVTIFPLCAVLFSVFACIFPQLLTPLSSLIEPLLGVIMLGMGTSLAVDDFARAVRRPKAVLIGMALQFLLMPLLAYGIGLALRLPRNSSSGW